MKALRRYLFKHYFPGTPKSRVPILPARTPNSSRALSRKLRGYSFTRSLPGQRAPGGTRRGEKTGHCSLTPVDSAPRAHPQAGHCTGPGRERGSLALKKTHRCRPASPRLATATRMDEPGQPHACHPLAAGQLWCGLGASPAAAPKPTALLRLPEAPPTFHSRPPSVSLRTTSPGTDPTLPGPLRPAGHLVPAGATQPGCALALPPTQHLGGLGFLSQLEEPARVETASGRELDCRLEELGRVFRAAERQRRGRRMGRSQRTRTRCQAASGSRGASTSPAQQRPRELRAHSSCPSASVPKDPDWELCTPPLHLTAGQTRPHRETLPGHLPAPTSSFLEGSPDLPRENCPLTTP